MCFQFVTHSDSQGPQPKKKFVVQNLVKYVILKSIVNGKNYLTSNQTSAADVYLDVFLYLGNQGPQQKKTCCGIKPGIHISHSNISLKKGSRYIMG